MKLSAALLLASIGASYAFSAGSRPSPARNAPPLRAAGGDDDELRTVSAPRGVASPSGFGEGFSGGVGDSPLMAGPDASPRRRMVPRRRSVALPFVNAPACLDGTLAGDVGFDPLGFADSYENLNNYREAEVKHGRLAMLAAAGWPLSELWDRGIADFLGMDPVLDESGRVPSVLNGGMGRISVAYWAGCLAFAAALDVYGSYFASKKGGYVAGDLGFDPLHFYPRGARDKDEARRTELRLSEIKHGRIAMIAITAYALQEFVSGTAVVDHASLFFKPIWQVLYDVSRGPEFEPSVFAPYTEYAEVASTAVPAVPEAVAPVASEAMPAMAPAIPEAAMSAAAPAVPEAASSAAPVASEAASAVAPVIDEAASEAAAEAVPAASDAVAATGASDVPPGGPAAELAAKQARIADLESTISLYESEASAVLNREIAEASNKIADLEEKLARIEALAK